MGHVDIYPSQEFIPYIVCHPFKLVNNINRCITNIRKTNVIWDELIKVKV
jgi:hypothetical protein